MSPSEDAAAPPLPLGEEGPAFAEPWQAQAFALTLALHERGVFAWPDFAAALGAALRETDDPGAYWACWLSALERLLAERGVVDPALVSARAEAWARAARATPHGEPIRLENDPRR